MQTLASLRSFTHSPEPLVVVAILSWNKVGLLRDCIESIFEHTLYPKARIAVLDQGSDDGTAAYLEGLGDRVDWIHTEENLGFVRGNNLIFGRYPERDVVLLNNDTLVTDGWLTSLIDCAYSEADIGVVGAKLLYPDGRLQEAGSEIFSDGSGWNIGKGDDADLKTYHRRKEVHYCSGACLYVKRKCLDLVGGFDERFHPAYYEDTDLCFSAREHGFKVVYEPTCKIFHLEGATAGHSFQSGAKRYQWVNRDKFVDKWKKRLARHRRSFWESPPAPGTDEREKILVIARTPPMLDRAAGELRLYHLLRILSEQYNVVFLACDATGAGRYIEMLRDLGIAVYGNDLERFPYIDDPDCVPPVDVEKLLAHNRFKAVWMEFHPIAQLYTDLVRRCAPGTAVLTDSVDVHYVREIREAETRRDGLLLSKALANKRKELAAYERSDLVVAVTEEDRKHLLEESPELDIRIVPTIHPVRERVPSRRERSGLIFIGGFSHPPNVDAVLFFMREVFPLVRAQTADMKLTIVGNRPPPEVLAFQGRGVCVTGYVPDTEPYLDAALVSVAPLRYGAGMKGKVGEAMANGVPVVTTSIGAEGLNVSHGEHVLIADSAEAFSRAILRLCRDERLWESLSKNAIEFVGRRYSPQAVEQGVLNLMASLPDPRARSTSRHALSSEPSKAEAGVCALSSITVVIPSRNARKATQRCVEAVGRCTESLYEILVVDNGSTDGTTEWLEQSHVKHIRNERNVGFGAACLQGIRMATSQFVAIVCPEGVVTPLWDRRLLQHIRDNPAIGAIAPVSKTPKRLQTHYELEESAWRLHEENRGRNRPARDLSVSPCILFASRALASAGIAKGQNPGAPVSSWMEKIRAAGCRLAVAEDVLVYQDGGDPPPAPTRRRPQPASRRLSVIFSGPTDSDSLFESVRSLLGQSVSLSDLEVIASVPEHLLPFQDALRGLCSPASLVLFPRETVSIRRMAEGAAGEYLVLIREDMCAGEGFLEKHMAGHERFSSEKVLIIGNGEGMSTGREDPLAAYLSSQPEQKDLGLACPPYFATSVSARREIFQQVPFREQLGCLWKIREFVYRAGLEGIQVICNEKAITQLCSPTSLKALLAEQKRSGFEAVLLARKHPNRMWSCQDLKGRVQRDFLGRQDVIEIVERLRQDLEDQRQNDPARFTHLDRTLLNRTYTTLLNHHYAWGAHLALTDTEGEEWCDRFLKSEYGDLDQARTRIDGENRMNAALLEGIRFKRMGDRDRALGMFQSARGLLPDSPYPHFCFGLHFLETFEWKRAEEAFEGCLERQGKYQKYTSEILPLGDEPSLSLFLALSCMARRHYGKAIRILQAALEGHRIQKAGKERLFLLYLARCHERNGLISEAADTYRQVLEHGPDEEASHSLFLLNLRLNRKEEAQRVLERSVRMNGKDLTLIPAKDGRQTVQARNNGTTVLLHSRYRPLEEACRNLPESEHLMDKIIVQLGVGLGYPLLALWSRIPAEGPILAVERNATLFHLALIHTLPAGSIGSKGLTTLIGKQDHTEVLRLLDALSRQYPNREVLILKHPPSFRLYPEYYESVLTRIDRSVPGVSVPPVQEKALPHVGSLYE